MEVVGCKARESSCTLRPAAMLFHGISGEHIQGIMEEMERRSKTESRLAKTVQMNGRESVRLWRLIFGSQKRKEKRDRGAVALWRGDTGGEG